MKTTSILFAALMMISVVALADEPAAPKLVVVSQKESGLFKVIYENPKSSKVKMTIFNSEGNALYTESIKATDGFILPVNFKGLTPGEYSIEVTDGTNKATHKVSYVANKAHNVHVSKLSAEANKYLLSVANEGVVNVRILDGASNIIHEQNITVKGSLGLVYNLKAIEGTPTFVVTNSEGVSKTIKY